jgi:hypothetical protein
VAATLPTKVAVLQGVRLNLKIDDDECGGVGGTRIDKENQSTQEKPAQVSLQPLQIPHDRT